jgi:hypothetical protein
MIRQLSLCVVIACFIIFVHATTTTCSLGSCYGPVKAKFSGYGCNGNVASYSELSIFGSYIAGACNNATFFFELYETFNCSAEGYIRHSYAGRDPTCAGIPTTIEKQQIQQCVNDYVKGESYVVLCNAEDEIVETHVGSPNSGVKEIFPYAYSSAPCGSSSGCSAVTATIYGDRNCQSAQVSLPVVSESVSPNTCYSTGISATEEKVNYANWKVSCGTGPEPYDNKTYFHLQFFGSGCNGDPYEMNSIKYGTCLPIEDGKSQMFFCDPNYQPKPSSASLSSISILIQLATLVVMIVLA